MILNLRREYRFGDEFGLTAYVNQQKIKIKYGDNKIELSPGSYQLRVKFLWFKSEMFDFSISNHDIELVCGLKAIDVEFNYGSGLLSLIYQPKAAFVIMTKEQYLEKIAQLYQE